MWRYGVGHSQLSLRSYGENVTDTLEIHFESVERVELSQSYPGGISVAVVESDSRYSCTSLVPRLLVTIISPSGNGFVVCSRMTIAQLSGESEAVVRKVILSIVASSVS